MQEIQTTIDIAAPPTQVWSILADLNGWPAWNPTVRAASGTLTKGAKLGVTMRGKEEGTDGPRYHPVITELDEGRRLRWRAHMMLEVLFTNEKVLELEATPEGTRLTHSEIFRGPMAALMSNQMAQGVPPMLESMNRALKQRAENQLGE